MNNIILIVKSIKILNYNYNKILKIKKSLEEEPEKKEIGQIN